MKGSFKGGGDVRMECMCVYRELCCCAVHGEWILQNWARKKRAFGVLGVRFHGDLGFCMHLSASHNTGMFHRIRARAIRKMIRGDDCVSPFHKYKTASRQSTTSSVHRSLKPPFVSHNHKRRTNTFPSTTYASVQFLG